MTANQSALKGGVERAVNQLMAWLGEERVHFRADGVGGAFVVVLGVPLRDQYEQPSTWIGFHILHNCPFPDTYPHYVRGDLSLKSGAKPGGPVSGPTAWEGLIGDLGRIVGSTEALQISRRSNRKSDDDVETPLEKLMKVIQWLNTR
jgi:hypothetical protein